VIGIDRPGIELSTWMKGYRLVDWPVGVAEFADVLSLKSFGIVGASSGGPYALACAHLIADRLTGCAVVAGISPLDVPHPERFIVKTELQIVRLANRLPFVARLAFRYFAWQFQRNPREGDGELPEEPAGLRQRDDVATGCEGESTGRVSRGSPPGCTRSHGQHRHRGRPWGFALEDVAMKVHIYQGELDSLVLPAAATYMAERLPNCELH